MALVKCPDCGRDVSDRAPTCPQCGRPLGRSPRPAAAAPFSTPASRRILAWSLGLGVVAIGIVVASGPPPSAPKSETIATPAVDVVFNGSQFAVFTSDDRTLRRCELVVNGSYRIQAGDLAPGGPFAVGAAELATRAGERFDPVALKPLRYRFSCDVPGGRAASQGVWR